MNRWARTQLGITIVGALLFVWAGCQGFGVGKSSSRFALHAQLGLLATLLALLGLIWMVTYVTACRRRLGSLPGVTPGDAASIARSVRGVAPTSSLAALATVAHFLLAGRVLAGGGGAALHGWSAATTVLLLLVSVVVAARGLTRHQLLVERLDGSNRVLNSSGS